MGIRFRCHHCETELHVKDFQAGKRGRCPDCKGRFRIPLVDAEHSLQADDASVDAEQVSHVTLSVTVEETGVSETDAPPAKAEQGSQVETKKTVAPQPPDKPLPLRPRALIDATQVKWYVRPTSGGQYGPATSESMWQWLSENRIGSDSLVWCEGWPEWQLAGEVFVDYFSTNESQPETVPAAPGSTNVPSLSNPGQDDNVSLTLATSTEAPSSSDRSRIARKQRRRRNYTVMIAILAVVMIALIVALAMVLNNQQYSRESL